MSKQDIRWEQRFSNYNKALIKLEKYVDHIKHNYFDDEEDADEEEQNEMLENLGEVLNDLVKQGLIQSFEYTHELAWNVIKDYMEYQGNTEIRGSRDAIKEAFSVRLIKDGEVWMEMIKSRNQTSHTYNEKVANEIFQKIINDFLPTFLDFRLTMEELRTGKQRDIFSK